MNILIGVHHLPPKYTGGAEWRAIRTASALQDRGHQVKVFCIERIDDGPTDQVSWSDEMYNGVQVRRLSMRLQGAPDPHRWEYDNPWVGEHIRQHLHKIQYDLFHQIGGYLISANPLRIAASMGIPTVLSLTDYWFMCRRINMVRSNGRICTIPVSPDDCARCQGEEKRRFRLPGRVIPWLMALYWSKQPCNRQKARAEYLLQTLNLVDCIIAPSLFIQKFFVKMGVNPERIIYLRQGRDSTVNSTAEYNRTESDKLRIGYIGQIAPHKGVHILFLACRKLPTNRFIVRAYGDTSHFPQYVKHLKELIAADDRFELVGAFQGQDSLRDIFQNLDVIVVPSIWYENSPNAILEAFVHHTPVIASNLGGMAELVQQGINGMLFETGNAEDLARQLRQLFDDPELIHKLRNGIRPVKSVTQEMDELESIYDRVIREKSLTT